MGPFHYKHNFFFLFMVVFIMMIIWFLLSELDSRFFFFLNGGRNVLVQAIVLRQGEGRRTKGGSRLLARTAAGCVVALFVGTEEKVEETHMATRFLIFQGRWDLVGLSMEHRRHERWRRPSRA